MARAQQLAGLALGDRQRQRHAENALAGCIVDEDQLAQLGEASVCHGWAGLVQTTHRAANDAGPTSALPALLPDLHTRFEQHLRRHQPPAGEGLLDGAAGVALTRHAAAACASRWDACLLISTPSQMSPEDTLTR